VKFPAVVTGKAAHAAASDTGTSAFQEMSAMDDRTAGANTVGDMDHLGEFLVSGPTPSGAACGETRLDSDTVLSAERRQSQ
jgi:hypothetical protein